MQGSHIVFRFVFLDNRLVISQSIIISAHSVFTFTFVKVSLGHKRTIRELTDVIPASGNGSLAITAIVFRFRRLESNGILTVSGDVHVLGTYIVEKLAGVAVFRVDGLQIG